jgi:hypothetical protein
MENIFTANIKAILSKHFGKNADEVFEKSQLVQYINEKPVRQTEAQKHVQVLLIFTQSM